MHARGNTFAVEAARRLAFLVHEHRFVGPEVVYSVRGQRLVVQVRYRHDRDVVLESTLSLDGATKDIATELSAGDAAVFTRRTGIASRSMEAGGQIRHALDLQVAALRDLFHIAVVVWGSGDLARPRDACDLAEQDWRDVLVRARFGNYANLRFGVANEELREAWCRWLASKLLDDLS